MRRAARLLCTILPVILSAAAFAGDILDGPAHVVPSVNDLGSLYVFRSPTNANNTVFAMTLGRCPGAATADTFDPDAAIELKIATRAGSIPIVRDELTFRITFGPAAGDDTQPVRLRRFHGRTGGTVLASGSTNQNLPIAGGGLFRAGLQDDPYFLDFVGVQQLLDTGPFPRPMGTATNFFGPNLNVLSVVFEVPSSTIAPNSAVILVWGRLEKAGAQLDRIGRPLVNTLLVPPVPRGPSIANPDPDRRDAFNAGNPSDDRDDFGEAMIGIYQDFFGRTFPDANALTNVFTPDVLAFQLGNPNGFGTFVTDGTGEPSGTQLGNGRRLRDDTTDVLVNVHTNGFVTTDNVADDNGMRVTDGNVGTVAAFPYMGAPNAVAQACPTP